MIDSFYSSLKQWLQSFYQSAPGAKEKLDKSIDVHKQEGYTGKSRAQEVMDNLPRLLPPITHAIHRFLDKDNDGSVSREEIEDLILLLIDFKEFGPKIFQIEDKTDHAARDLTEFISDLFRLLGSSSHDRLSADDSMIFITAMLDMMSDGVLSLMKKVEEYVTTTKPDLMELVEKMLQGAPVDMQGPNGGIATQSLIDYIQKENLGNRLDRFWRSYLHIKETVPPDILMLGQNFVDKFKEEVGENGNELPIETVAEIAAYLLKDLLNKYVSADVVIFTAATIWGKDVSTDLGRIVRQIVNGNISPRFYVSILSSITGAIHRLLTDMGGLEDITLIILEFFDLNSDGIITYEEAFSIYDAYKNMIKCMENWPSKDSDEHEKEFKKSEYLAYESKFAHALLRLVNANGEITAGDFGRLFDKATALIKEILTFILNQFKKVILEFLPSVFTILLQMKYELLSRSFLSTSLLDSISSEEILEVIIKSNLHNKSGNDENATKSKFSGVSL